MSAGDNREVFARPSYLYHVHPILSFIGPIPLRTAQFGIDQQDLPTSEGATDWSPLSAQALGGSTLGSLT